MRLIDADKLIEDIHKRNYINKALSEIFETIIDEQPTAFSMGAKPIDDFVNPFEVTANVYLATAILPFTVCEYLISGSLVSLPHKITRFI